MCAANRYVRFTPNSERKSGFPRNDMSALPPKADECSARTYVRFGPETDIALLNGLDLKQSIRSHNRVIAAARIEVFVHRTERGESRHRDRIFKTGTTLTRTDNDDGRRPWRRFLWCNCQRTLTY